jgi:hypothetical protein
LVLRECDEDGENFEDVGEDCAPHSFLIV